MKKIKVLNGYAGIGGNRKLWPDKEIEVTAVEINPEIAKIYQDFFPNDKVIIGDAHKYLLEHYKEFDFIWTSPPCPTHSDIKRCNVQGYDKKAEYADMRLYQEIILLTHFSKGLWVVENVRPYYTPLIIPMTCGRHYFWSNFHITNLPGKEREHFDDIASMEKVKGIKINQYKIKDKRKIIRNCVKPEVGLHIFNCAFKIKQLTL